MSYPMGDCYTGSKNNIVGDLMTGRYNGMVLLTSVDCIYLVTLIEKDEYVQVDSDEK